MPVATQSNGSSSRRFELPALAHFDSLTAGTDIPPPPDSPISEKAPTPPQTVEPINVSAHAEGASHTNSHGSTNGYSGRGRTSDSNPPMSPVSQTRPGSIRRFLSRKSLNSNYTNGTNSNASVENLHSMRPESSLSMASTAGTSKKRSSSWFRRMIGGSSNSESTRKRTSVVYEERVPVQEYKGPPPPKLPELKLSSAKSAAAQGSLGAEDMFKNIK